MGWRVNERVENAWYRLRICLSRLSESEGYFTDEFISSAQDRTRLGTVEISINHGRHSAGEDAVGLPHGHDLREGAEWIQLFEKSRMENYKNKRVMSFDEVRKSRKRRCAE